MGYSGIRGDDATEAVLLLKRIFMVTKPEVQQLFEESGRRAMDLLTDRENWKLVERLADELVKRKYLGANEVVAIVPVAS